MSSRLFMLLVLRAYPNNCSPFGVILREESQAVNGAQPLALSEVEGAVKNLDLVGQILRLRLRMTNAKG